MMRSLWSGVSGLQAHQTGIDVEGNNIANVNTVGYKKSRTNFQDYMPQTRNPALSPQGKLGGTDSTQVGTGASVMNVQKVFSQGPTQNTDVKTDMAINKDGWFIVSDDGGKTYKYTRAGQFKFDANGNFTNANGLIVQGWMADKNYEINSTGGIRNIVIKKGIAMPAKATQEATISANLNAGKSLKESERGPARVTIKPTSDLNGLFSYAGQEVILKPNIDKINIILTRKFNVNGVETESTSTHYFTYGKSASQSDGFFTSIGELLDEINVRIKDSTGTYDNKVLLTGDGEIAAAGHIIAVNGSNNPKTAAANLNMGQIRNYEGEDLGMTAGQQIRVNFDPASGATGPTTVLTYGTDFNTIAELVTAINAASGVATASVSYNDQSGFLKDANGVLRNVTALDSTGNLPKGGTSLERLNGLLGTLGGRASHSYTIRGNTFYDDVTTNSILHESFHEASSGYFLSKPLKIVKNAYLGSDDVGELFTATGEKMMVKAGDGLKVSVSNLKEERNFVYREPKDTNKLSYLTNDFQDKKDVTIATQDQSFRWLRDGDGNTAFMTTGQKIVIAFDTTTPAGQAMGTKTYTYGTPDGFRTISDLVKKVNLQLEGKGRSESIKFDTINGWIADSSNIMASMTVVKSNGTPPDANTPLARLNTLLSSIDTTVNSHSQPLKKNDTYYFTNTQELINLYQDAIDDAADATNSKLGSNAIRGRVSMDDNGRISIKNLGSETFNVSTKPFPNVEKHNKLLLNSMGPLTEAEITIQSSTASNRLLAPTFRTSIQTYDISGSKTEITLHFKKTHSSNKPNDPSVWKWYAEVPEPASIEFPSFGQIMFNADGSLRGYTPPSIRLNANAGLSNSQDIQLNLGSINGFDGFTSFADDSDTKNSTQDGYAGGSLRDVIVNKAGVLIGEFSNDQTKQLAKVSLATFANNGGLVQEGGNLYSKSANSGDPQVGVAGVGDKGTIAPKNLEMSNVDLSRSLTNLIVIQRGFQANSKTITTSDQMLNTLLQLKQ